MPRPRKSLICLDETPYYHCISRCVRRAFLCGKDHYTGKSYEHRRNWVEGRLFNLAKVFAIDVCAYSIMSNHTHLVLHVDKSKAESWSTEEVLNRWHALHKGTLLTRQYMRPDIRDSLSDSQMQTILASVSIYRHRLYDISWFMRLLNEFIAREANKEDECTGHFWEGRFKSQALLDEAAIAACMAYVDLNPIRAGIANTTDTSDFTSIKKRIVAAKKHTQPTLLYPFMTNKPMGHKKVITSELTQSLPFYLEDYINLVELTARQLNLNTIAHIIDDKEPIIKRAKLNKTDWYFMVINIETQFSTKISRAIASYKHIQAQAG